MSAVGRGADADETRHYLQTEQGLKDGNHCQMDNYENGPTIDPTET
jgi:hypothetical protein